MIELISILIVPFILLAALFVQANFFWLARKKRKDDLFQLRFQYFKRLLEFWKQTEIDLSLIAKDYQDGMNHKAIEYLKEKRNLITEAGFLFGSAAEEFLKKSATRVEWSNDVFSTNAHNQYYEHNEYNEYTEFYHPADLLNYFKPYLQIEK